MMIDEITEKIIESKNNDIAKAFTMHIGSLLINNGIVPVMTEYTGNDVKNITDTNEYKLVMEYGVAFKELDCSMHDKEIYNKAIDDAICKVEEHKTKGYVTGITSNPFEFGACQMADDIVKILKQLKAGEQND